MAQLQDPGLAENTVHVWRVPLVASRQEQSAAFHWLSPDERTALERMSEHTDRERRTIAWGRLRYILSRYLDHPPSEIDIRRRPSERPEILHPSVRGGLRFNLSHSGAQALVAISRGPVGADIERIRPLGSVDRLARRFFTPSEATALDRLSGDAQTRCFFRLWVLKEAYLKAAGAGVPDGLSRCEIALDGEGPRVVQPVESAMETNLHLRDIPVSGGYAAAVAVCSDAREIAVFDL